VSRKLTVNFGKFAGVIGALLALSVGLFLLHFNSRLGTLLVRASYDWSFDLSFFGHAAIQDSDVVIVYMDEKSHRDLGQPFNRPWDRALHAKLIDRLTADGARAVIFDVLFTDPGPDPMADEALARAIKDNGRVILAAENQPARQAIGSREVVTSWTLNLPFAPFAKAAAGWGLAQLEPDEDFIIRQHYHGPVDRNYPSLTWAAATNLNLAVTRDPTQRRKERWINYYSRQEHVPHVSYSHVQELRPGFFRDRVVFVGARPIAGSFIERRDELRSPYFSWDETFRFVPAVEVQAIVFLNLLRGDWLQRLSPAGESALLLITALIFGFGLCRFRPLPATGAALAGVVVALLLAMLLFAQKQMWFPWMIVALGQIPAALLWAVLYKSVDWFGQKRRLEQARKQVELQIREQAELLDKARDAIAVRDLEGRLLFWNQGAERVYGWTAAEVLGKNANELLYETPPPQLKEAQSRVVAEGEWNGELRQRAKDGKTILVESRWSLVRDEQAQPKAILVINTDVTERRQLEAQFLRAQRMESIGTLAGGIAHDLNNVLTPILMGVDLLRLGHKDEKSLKLLQNIETSARRGAGMVKQVLTFARGHEGERTTMRLGPLVKEMVKIAAETFPKSIRIRARLADDLSAVSGDATQLHQVLLNLCVNARDAMPDGGEILITAENAELTEAAARKHIEAKPGKYVVLSVADTGSGIPSEIMDRIFEPFFTTKEVGKGTGLGLATVQSIIKSHQGFLDLTSEVGKGTTFTIHLPAVEAATPVEDKRPPRPVAEARGELVLVVDDEAPIREIVQAALVKQGYRVLTAANGAEAIALCSEHIDDVHCVILDMMMPVMDGPTAIPILKKLKPGLRFIGISGLLQADKIKKQIAADNVAFLTKPFSTDKLLETLQAFAQSQAPPATATVTGSTADPGLRALLPTARVPGPTEVVTADLG
jgi:PAS domain S-box-containing protein